MITILLSSKLKKKEVKLTVSALSAQWFDNWGDNITPEQFLHNSEAAFFLAKDSV